MKRPTEPPQASQGQRWGLVVAVGLAALVVAAGLWTWRQAADDGLGKASDQAGAYVGGDLHTLTVVDGRLFVGGHDGVATSTDGGKRWEQVASLRGADAMGWAVTPAAILVGGHSGLFRSTVGSLSFGKADGLGEVSDVHALGAAGNSVYLASPQAGLLASSDGGVSWTLRNSSVGQGFMGTILVDPTDPNRVVAPDMQNGVVTSTDGGRSWTVLGGPGGTMSLDWDPTRLERMVAVGMGGGAVTTDGGRTWADLQLPQGTSAVTFSADGTTLYAAALDGQTARVAASTDGGTTWKAV
ncbi:MAG: hypothetical protein H0V07_02350 [Propionibacteriales bacterium]|nr:hypothetical protein [Propionibacteriales bacterium]